MGLFIKKRVLKKMMTREEKIKFNIQEHDEHIANLNKVINGLLDVQEIAKNDTITEIQVFINKLNTEIDFIEDIRNDDEVYLKNNF